jgi:hypothetical protein
MSNICERCGCNIMDEDWICDVCSDEEGDDWPYYACSEEVEDVINEPSHYARWSIEPITYIMRNGMEFWRGNLIKYSSRAGFKIYDGKTQEESEITDLEKVKRYCDMRINQIKGEVEL